MKSSRAYRVFEKIKKRIFNGKLDHVGFAVSRQYRNLSKNKRTGRPTGVVAYYDTRLNIVYFNKWFLKHCTVKHFYFACIHELTHALLWSSGIKEEHGKDFAIELLKRQRMWASEKDILSNATKKEIWYIKDDTGKEIPKFMYEVMVCHLGLKKVLTSDI